MKLITTTTAAVLLGLSSTVMAGNDTGPYVGFSVGQASLDFDEASVDINDDDNGYKVFGGFNFGWIPLINIGGELAYVNLGSPKGSEGTSNVSLESSGYTAFAVVGANIAPFIGVFGKLGYFFWDVDMNQVNVSDSGSDNAIGVGAKAQLGSIAVRAEFERFKLDDADIDYFSVGAFYTF